MLDVVGTPEPERPRPRSPFAVPSKEGETGQNAVRRHGDEKVGRRGQEAQD